MSQARVVSNLVPGLMCAAAATLALSACSGSESRDAREPTTATVESTTAPAPSKTRVLRDRGFTCRSKVDLDLVRVTIRTALEDAISLDENCSGRIGRIEVDTWTADGIKVQNSRKVAHDLVIESGYVLCHDLAEGAHQDGIQVMGGERLTFRNLRVDCLGNANLFLSEGGLHSGTPTDVVCENCVLGPRTSQTLFYGDSIRSGARNATICTGVYRAIRIEPGAEAIVSAGNKVLPHDDPACADVTGTGGSR